MLTRIIIILVILIGPVSAKTIEKFFEIKLKSCNQKSAKSEFIDPHFYHPLSFDINFNEKIYKKPINLIKACKADKGLKFIINK